MIIKEIEEILKTEYSTENFIVLINKILSNFKNDKKNVKVNNNNNNYCF